MGEHDKQHPDPRKLHRLDVGPMWDARRYEMERAEDRCELEGCELDTYQPPRWPTAPALDPELTRIYAELMHYSE